MLTKAQTEILTRAARDPYGWISRYGVRTDTLRVLYEAGFITKGPTLIGSAREENIEAIEALLTEANRLMGEAHGDGGNRGDALLRDAREKLKLAQDLAYQLTAEVWRITEDGRQAVQGKTMEAG